MLKDAVWSLANGQRPRSRSAAAERCERDDVVPVSTKRSNQIPPEDSTAGEPASCGECRQQSRKKRLGRVTVKRQSRWKTPHPHGTHHEMSHTPSGRLDARRVTYENHHHLSGGRRTTYKIPYREVVVMVVSLGTSLDITEGGP